MVHHLRPLLVAALYACLAASAWGQSEVVGPKRSSDSRASAKGGKSDETVSVRPGTMPVEVPVHKVPGLSFVSVVQRGPGQQALVIDYRWQVHRRPSVEVQLVSGDPANSPTIGPFCFLTRYFNGDGRTKVFRALDHSGESPRTESFTKDEIAFQVFAQRNSLGTPAVLIVPERKGSRPEAGASAVFPILDAWSVNDRMLRLDLPREQFAKPGTLYVWFLREDKVLWEQRVAWPGY